ncbi:hypothetical protein CEK26_000506 [Fusarium fujikuroi]
MFPRAIHYKGVGNNGYTSSNISRLETRLGEWFEMCLGNSKTTEMQTVSRQCCNIISIKRQSTAVESHKPDNNTISQFQDTYSMLGAQDNGPMNEHDNRSMELVPGRPNDKKTIPGMYIVAMARNDSDSC